MFSHSALLLTAAISTVSAQYFGNNTLGSCVDVDCPSAEGPGTRAECRVTNRTHAMIGLESFSTSITEDQNNLTWTVGTHVYENTDPNNASVRVIEKSFYLGTPSSLKLDDDELPYEGCAIFLYSNELLRPAMFNGTKQCSEVIGHQCYTNLLKDATALLVSGSNGTETAEAACERVQRGLDDTFSSGCSDVSGGDSWNGVAAIPLTGETAPQLPSQSANESTTCHPTLPKSNDLRFVFGYNDTGTNRGESTIPMFYAINLVLTMFWSPNRTAEAALSVPDSHLSCLWPIDLNNEQLKTARPGGAFRIAGSGFVAGVVAVAIAMAVMA